MKVIFRMYKELTKNVAITIRKDKIYLQLKKYRPVVISADDKFRKGIEVKLCSKCKTMKVMVMSCCKRDYCESCTNDYFKKLGKLHE